MSADRFTLETLEKIVAHRAAAPADQSYTAQLLGRGIEHVARKLGEEAVETIIAALGPQRERVVAESADLLYHLLVVLAARGVTLDEVYAELARRTGQSGLDEKASRRPG